MQRVLALPNTTRRKLSIVEVCLYIFMVTLPFENVSISGSEEAVSLCRISLILLTGATLLNFAKCWAKFPKANYAFGAYLVYVLVRSAFETGEERDSSFLQCGFILQYLLLFWLLSNLFAWPGVAKRAVIFYFIGQVAVLLLPLFGVYELEVVDETRRTFLGQDPNIAAFELGLGVLAAVGTFFIWSKAQGVAVIPTGLVVLWFLYHIVLTGSRGALVAVLAGVLWLLVPRLRVRSKGTWLGLALVVLLCGALYRMITQEGAVMDRISRTIFEGDVSGRDKILTEAYDMFVERPLFGWGLSRSTAELGTRTRTISRGERSAHNLLLSQLIEGGLVGAALFYTGMFLALKSAWTARLTNHGRMALGFAFSILVVQLSLSWFWQKSLWCFLAYAYASRAAVSQPQPKPRHSFAMSRMAELIHGVPAPQERVHSPAPASQS